MFNKMKQVSLRSTINHIVCDFNVNNNCEKDEDDFSWSEIVSKCLQGRQQQMLGQIPEISMSEASSMMLPPDDLFETEVGREVNFSVSLLDEEAVKLPSPKLRNSFTLPQTNPSSPILANSLIERSPSPQTSRSTSSTFRSANKSNRSNRSNKSNKSSTSSTVTPLVSRSSARSTSRSSSLADTSIGSLNSPPNSPINSPVNSPVRSAVDSTVDSPINSPSKSVVNSPKRLSTITPNEELINNENDYESIAPLARVSTSSTSRLTTLIEKVANTPAKVTTPKKSLSRISSSRVSTSSTIHPTTLTPTKISARPKRFLKNKRIQTWRGEHPIYVPLENGCYKIIGTSAPHTPDFMKRKRRVILKRKKVSEPKEKEPDDQVDVSETFVEKSETTKEKLAKIFLNRENLNWKKLKIHKNLEHATLIKSKEANQIVGYFRFIEKCNKPVNKTGQYLSLYILMEGSITIKIEDEPPVLIKKSDPVIIPPETNYSMENMIDGESILLFCIL